MLTIPQDASYIIDKLNAAGFQAYVVGGCVRDTILTLAPNDWDLCTDAKPTELQCVFAADHVVATGLKHGTLTVVLHHVPYEVTTFRVDGAYTDHRHPDSVSFVADVREDLARRDFTINAMAYAPQTGLVDAFGGQADLRAGLIRCVGDPTPRFTEDALRILRALRFAATYGFTLDPATAEAARTLAPTLTNVAAERIRAELAKLLCGRAAADVLRAYPDIVGVVLPELLPMIGFEQHTPYHRYDVWEHTLRALAASPAEEILRWTLLLHDSGKPDVFTLDDTGVGHAYGHQKRSRELAEQVLTRLKVDRATYEAVVTLVEKHDIPLEAERPVMVRRLHQMGETNLRRLIAVQRADALSKGTMDETVIENVTEARISLLDRLLAENACVSLKQLAVDGRALLQSGIPAGPVVGRILNALLAEVMAERLPNERDALLRRAAELLSKEGASSC